MNSFKDLIQYRKQFGTRLTVLKLILFILQWSKFFKGLFKKLNKYKHKLVRQRIQSIIPMDVYNQLDYASDKDTKVIWTFWYQGQENAPDIVKACFLSMKDKFEEYELRILDKNTYKEYYQPSSNILEKMDKGIISITHFSDLLRMHLLDTYGGMWIDATLYVCERPFQKSTFYTIKNVDGAIANISKGRWCTFMLGGNNPKLYRFVSLMLEEYWKHFDGAIDYFIFDYIIDIAYENIQEVRDYIDGVPNNNGNFFKLRDCLNTIVTNEQFEELLSCNQIHKLTYKMDFINDSNSVYNRLITKIGGSKYEM